MTKRQRVGIAEYRVVQSTGVLVAYGLGSCLGICIFDAQNQIGGLAHTLLPQDRPGLEKARVTKFVEAAIRLMVEDLLHQGAARENLEAKIAGGANMFESEYLTLVNSIGARNARMARETLLELGIPLVAEEVGGNRGRTVEFHVETAAFVIKSARDHEPITL